MAIATLTILPAAFHAGDTIRVRVSSAEFQAPEWTLKLAFNGPAQFTVNAVADGADHLVTVPTGTTENVKPGVYSWAEIVSNAATGERQTLRSGNVWIQPNADVSVLSFDAECLELIRAHIKGRLPAGLQSHAINGTPISKIPLLEARKMEKDFLARVHAEQLAALDPADGEAGVIHISFTR